LNLITNKKLL